MDGKGVRAVLAGNIKEFRSRRNWSQADLAEKTGLFIVYLSDSVTDSDHPGTKSKDNEPRHRMKNHL